MRDSPSDDDRETEGHQDAPTQRGSDRFQLQCTACSFERSIQPQFSTYLDVSDAHANAEGEDHLVEFTRVSSTASD